MKLSIRSLRGVIRRKLHEAPKFLPVANWGKDWRVAVRLPDGKMTYARQKGVPVEFDTEQEARAYIIHVLKRDPRDTKNANVIARNQRDFFPLTDEDLKEGDVATGLYASLGRTFITGPEKDPNNTPETPHEVYKESEEFLDEGPSDPGSHRMYEYLLDVAANIKSIDTDRLEAIEREMRSMRIKPVRIHQILSLVEELNEMQVELDHLSDANEEDSDEFAKIEEEHYRLEQQFKNLMHLVGLR